MNPLTTDLSLAFSDPDFCLAPELPKPDFFLIGGAKCGTTSFAAYLPLHPQVAPWKVKEPNYWSWRRPTTEQYQGLFANIDPPQRPGESQQVAGDYSTSSLLHPMVPRRVCASLPDTKIILMLRNPIDRAYSHYMMSQRSGLEENQSFEAIVRREMNSAAGLLEAHRRGFGHPSGDSRHCYSDRSGASMYFSMHNQGWTDRPFRSDTDLQAFYFTSYIFRSIYCDQVERWLTLFPREQILIMQSELFFNDPASHMAVAAEFLGLHRFDFSDEEEIKRHYAGSAAGDWTPPEKYPALGRPLRKVLRTFFEPYNQKLYSLIGEDYGWK